MRRLLALAGLIAAEMAAVLGLARLGSLPWMRVPLTDLSWWLHSTPPEDALAAAMRLAALGCATWLLASTVLYVLARLSGAGGAMRLLERTLPRPMRAVADRALAAVLAGSAIVGGSPVLAADLAPPGRWPPAHPPAFHLADDAAPAAALSAGPGRRLLPSPEIVAGPRAAVTAPPALAGTHHEVRPGENLWTIAAGVLARRADRPFPEIAAHQIRTLWLELIAANRDRLRSGAPDLIYPGERLRLPASPADADVGAAPDPDSAGADSASGDVGAASEPAAAAYALPVARELLSDEVLARPHHDYPAWDLPLPEGTAVSAVHGGDVSAVTPAASRCGNGVVISGHDGHRYTYCHAQTVVVAEGQTVAAGQRIMSSGASGNATGPHLHLAISTPAGEPICPQPLVRAWLDTPDVGPAEITTTDCV